MVTVKDIIHQAKVVLSHIEEVDQDGVRYFEDDEAKILNYMIQKYESNQ